MKTIVRIIILFLIFHPETAFSVNNQTDIPKDYEDKYALAQKYISFKNYDKARKEYDLLREQIPESFSVAYGYGRLLADMKLFKESNEALRKALNIGMSKGNVFDFTIYNTLGFVSIFNGNYDQALDWFNDALSEEKYKYLCEESQMKLHNNTGYVLMLLDRYEESLVHFYKAKELGSLKALYNIERVNSLIETQRKQDPNMPGVFASVVGSAKYEENAYAEIEKISVKLGVSKDKLEIYIAETGRYFITFGSNYSYIKAKSILNDIKKKQISDAFVASTTSWTRYKCTTSGSYR